MRSNFNEPQKSVTLLYKTPLGSYQQFLTLLKISITKVGGQGTEATTFTNHHSHKTVKKGKKKNHRFL